MHDYAITKFAVDRSRINKRLFIPKLLFLPAILFAIVSQHVYAEDGFWDTTWEVVSFLILMIAAHRTRVDFGLYLRQKNP